MNDLQVFENVEFGQIRTVMVDSEPWFVGKDIAEILGYAKPLNALATHIDEDDSLKQGLIYNTESILHIKRCYKTKEYSYHQKNSINTLFFEIIEKNRILHKT